ncbi:hypothetical protein F5887DRAFT_883571 [Amanita rubescens]|nr:hypothetical protein F5887DRAFT_883571 [Amanita rubescens]
MAVSASRPPHKRLRTSASPIPTISSIDSATSRTAPVPSKSPNPLGCSSCHRLLSQTKLTNSISRCSAPTCAVCSRTCTARVPSQPPTPHLTWSPSPSPPQSPRYPNTSSSTGKTGHVTGKRRKASQDDFIDQISNSDGSEDDYGIGPGCGRTVCRDCSVENIQSNTISCYDCYGH